MSKPPTRDRAGGGAGRAARTRRRTRTKPSNPDPSAVSAAQPLPSVGQTTTAGNNSTSTTEERKPEKPAKRPVLYSRALAHRICAAIIEGSSVREIGDAKGMPAAGTIYKWVAHDQGAKVDPANPEMRVGGFRSLYQEAKALQTEILAEELLAIADDGRNDWIQKYDHEGRPAGIVLDKEAVMRSRLRVETRKWLLSKMAPKKWGERVQVEASGPDGGPIHTKSDNAPLTLPALDLVLARLAKLAPKKDDDEGEGGASPVPA